MAAPFFAYLDQLRKLEGEPKVTFPEGHSDFPVTERVIKEVRIKPALAYLSPEPDTTLFPSALLVTQVETGGDRHKREWYRQWRTLPGPLMIREEDDAETNTPAIVGTQAIIKPTSFPMSRVIGSFSADYTTDVLTMTAHGLPTGLCVRVSNTPPVVSSSSSSSSSLAPSSSSSSSSSGSGLPAGLLPGVDYWVISATANTLQLSATVDGPPINLTTNGSGTHSLEWGSGTKLSYEPRGTEWGIRTSASLLRWLILSTSSTDWDGYPCPTLVFGVYDLTRSEARDGTTRLAVRWNKRSAHSRVLLHTVTSTYGTGIGGGTGQLAQENVFRPVLEDCKYDGVWLDFNHGPCLFDAFSITNSSSSENPKWPFLGEIFATGASATSASGFLTPGNKIISAPIAPWGKYDLWKKRTVTVAFP